ncbi:ribosomal protein S5 domain 2-type protein [Lactifluus volemus]|nr:ribosomal protein S5 domain 2-type protein [Lactifluus volemus]
MTFSRADGRRNEEIRALHIVYERLGRVDGSARFGFGDTKALASISGPIEVRLASEQPSKATFEAHVRPLSSLPGTESKCLAASLRGLLSPSLSLIRNPRTLIQLVVQSLTPSTVDGFSPSLIAACINASSLALLNAGSIPMTGVVCAAAVSWHRPSKKDDALSLVLDPSETESREGLGCGCFAFLFATEIGGSQQSSTWPNAKLVWTNWHAKGSVFDEGELARAHALGFAGAETVWKAIKQSVPEMGGLHSLPPLGQPTEEELEDVAQSGDDFKVNEEESDDAKVEI